ncbi:hypothetical protein P3342_010884 [Pyrenophora teres f. teres]|nr:hypothetical protein P3342_010884 [Pyrenophora teres f. teres]
MAETYFLRSLFDAKDRKDGNTSKELESLCAELGELNQYSELEDDDMDEEKYEGVVAVTEDQDEMMAETFDLPILS